MSNKEKMKSNFLIPINSILVDEPQVDSRQNPHELPLDPQLDLPAIALTYSYVIAIIRRLLLHVIN